MSDSREPIMRIETAADLKKIKPPMKGNERHPVEGCPSLYFKITPNGAKAWTYRYRPKLGPKAGADREYTIGEYPLFGLGLARQEYRDLRRRVARGEDPLGEIQDARAAPTMGDLAKAFAEEHCPRISSGETHIWRFERYILPRMGSSLKVAAVTHADCDALHRSLKHKPVQANRVISTLKTAFNFAIKRGWITHNPAAHISRFAEQPRERYLTDEEVPRLFAALANCRNQAVADSLRLILLTGCRRGEMMAMRWADVDLQSGAWTKPTTKTGRRHKVPLSAPALEVIARQPRKGEFVFPCRDLKRWWQEIRAEAGIEDMTIHDLRHSAASFLASDGESLRIIGELLGHRSPATTQRYAHIHDRAARAAAERLGRRLTEKPRLEAVLIKRGAS